MDVKDAQALANQYCRELKHLRALNAELVEACKQSLPLIAHHISDHPGSIADLRMRDQMLAAIAKAKTEGS